MTVDYEEETILAITSIQQDTAKLDIVLDKTAITRDSISAKLEDAVAGLKLDPATDKPMVMEAKLALITTTMNLLNDIDKQQFNRVKLKSLLTQTEDNNAHSKAVVDMLSRISLTGAAYIPFDESAADKAIDMKFSEADGVILDTELRDDPTDLT